MDIVHNQLLKLNKKFTYSKKNKGGEVITDPNKITTTKHYQTIINSNTFKEKLKDVMMENNNPERLMELLETFEEYRIFDFIIDSYKFPYHIKELNQYVLYILILLIILIALSFMIFLKLLMSSK